MGILGVSLLTVAVVAYMVRLAQTFRAARTREGKAYSLAALGALVVYLIFMATDNAIDYVTSCGIFVFALIAMSEKSRELEQQDALVRPIDKPTVEPADSNAQGFSIPSMPSRRFSLVSWK